MDTPQITVFMVMATGIKHDHRPFQTVHHSISLRS
jgi:hypothetical protein